jgi:cysteine-rich repeat protein
MCFEKTWSGDSTRDESWGAMQRFHEERNARRSRVSGLRIAVLVALATLATLAASGSCTIDGGVTRCEKTDLHCPPGSVCSADQDVCIRAGSCGNGIVSDGEVCDDGNNKSGDGCSSDCLSTEECGNRILDIAAGEQCDDGNQRDGDGCSADCRLVPDHRGFDRLEQGTI